MAANSKRVSFLLALVMTVAILTPSVFSGENGFPDLKIRTHLKRINNPSLKSIKSPYGDMIDCVPNRRAVNPNPRVTMEGVPIKSYEDGENCYEATAVESDEKTDTSRILGKLFEEGSFKKLYDWKHLINGFSAHVSSETAETLRRAPGVKSVNRDWTSRRLPHTLQSLWAFQCLADMWWF